MKTDLYNALLRESLRLSCLKLEMIDLRVKASIYAITDRHISVKLQFVNVDEFIGVYRHERPADIEMLSNYDIHEAIHIVCDSVERAAIRDLER
jgi:predicted RNA-binding protein